jgi:hypothetical protein
MSGSGPEASGRPPAGGALVYLRPQAQRQPARLRSSSVAIARRALAQTPTRRLGPGVSAIKSETPAMDCQEEGPRW